MKVFFGLLSFVFLIGCASGGGGKRPIPLYALYDNGVIAHQKKTGNDGKYWVYGADRNSYYEVDGIAMKEGTFELPPLHTPRSKTSSGQRIVGRGPGKTIIKGTISVEEIRDLHFMNLTLDNVKLHLKSHGPKLHFYNVEVIGQLDTEVEKGNTVRDDKEQKSIKRNFTFYLSDFHEIQKLEKQPYREGDTFPIIIKDSRLRKGSEFVKYPVTRQFVDRRKNLPPLNLQNLTAESNRAYMPGPVDGHGKFVFGAKPVDQKKIDKYVALAGDQAKKGNFLTAQFYIKQAQIVNFNREDKKLSGLLKSYDTQFHKEYSCKIRAEKANGVSTKFTGNTFETQLALKKVAQDSMKSIDQFTSNLAENCKITAYLQKDLLKYDKSKEVLISSKPIYEESAASKMREAEAARARRVAKEAQWKAAMAKTEALVNNMTSQAKFRHENRNRIETRSSGTYLVLNNKTYKPKPNLNYQSAVREAQKAQAKIVQGGTEYVLKGYEMHVKYHVDYGETMFGSFETIFKGSKKTYSLPAIDNSFRRNCEVIKNTATRRDKPLGNCSTASQASRVENRAERINKKYKKDLEAFFAKVEGKINTTVAKKARSKDPATQLEAALLKDRLSGQSSDHSKIENKLLL